jgi:polygalacturonase
MRKLFAAVGLLLLVSALWLRRSSLFPRAATSPIAAVSPIAATSPINVANYGASGNGTTDDTAAITSAIAALRPGDTLSFPCGTYLTTSQLTLKTSDVTLDGGGCATIHNTASETVMVIGSSGNKSPLTGPAVALSTKANELATGFTTVSSLDAAPGDYVALRQGGKDSSSGSGDTDCDVSGCRGEVLKVASVSGNTVRVTTALHDTYDPAVNGATARKILTPLIGISVKNITLDGSGSNLNGLAMAGVAESTVSGVTSRNVQGSAIVTYGNFNVAWSNITVAGAGSDLCGSAVMFVYQGNLSVNGMSISSENPGEASAGCLSKGAFGFGLIASANGSISNLIVDADGAYGRPFKTVAARWNTFSSLTVKNGVRANNGVSLEYYSSHNKFNNCVVTNNGAGTGTGTGNAGINTFGNFNQYNVFNNCTVTGNGNVQFMVSNFDALRLAQDSNATINGGTFTGTNTLEPVIDIHGANVHVQSANINGPGSMGLYLGSINACVNNNTFGVGTGLAQAISSNSSTNVGSANILDRYRTNLTPGTCPAT